MAAAVLTGCGAPEPQEEFDPAALSWQEITQRAEATRVTMQMWTGDPAINAFMNGHVRPYLKQQYDIDLDIVSGVGSEVLAQALAVKEAGRTRTQIDVVWINGENFYQLRQIDALFGPFTDQLPNDTLVRWDDPSIAFDFQQPLEGYEAPWGNVQFLLVYDRAQVATPPTNRKALLEWAKANPGRFTFDSGFTGISFLKTLLIDAAGGPGSLDGAFDEEKYRAASRDLWVWLKEIQPYLWREGQTFPAELSQVHRMFASGELAFTMSMNDGEVDNKVAQGLFPQTAYATLLDAGSLRNSHYLGILQTADNKAGAMVVINALQSPLLQQRKLEKDIWGDGTVLDIDRLDPGQQQAMRDAGARQRIPPRSALDAAALAEPAPEVTIRLNDDFRRFIVNGAPLPPAPQSAP